MCVSPVHTTASVSHCVPLLTSTPTHLVSSSSFIVAFCSSCVFAAVVVFVSAKTPRFTWNPVGFCMCNGFSVYLHMVAFSSLARILEECSTIHSPPALFGFVFWVDLTMLLKRHSVGTYPETSSHATCQGTCSYSHISSCWATVDWSWQKEWN